MKKQLFFLVGTIACLCFVAVMLHFIKHPVKNIREASSYHVSEKKLLSPIDFSMSDSFQTAEAKTSEAPGETPDSVTESPETAAPHAGTSLSEAQIYSYLQGPKSWGSKKAWSGKWGVTFYDGAKFGAFGCGLCCMANLYCSLTPYKCTPVDAYHYAKKNTGYHGGGAIDWGYMRDSLSLMGFSCSLGKKPKTYGAFQKMITANLGTITLISSNESKCYWTDNPGHYVTIFLYDQKTDKVFLADSGVPEHNRQWISLKLIYKSLKTASAWQLLSVTDYQKDKDTWKHKNASGSWVKK